MEHATKARALFKEGYNCAQAVAGAFCEEMGMDFESAVKLASSFGGGMGGLRETCGAVTGMFMVAGMANGFSSPEDHRVKTEHYEDIRALAENFRGEFGTLICRDLLSSLPGKLQQNPLPRTEEYYKVRPCVLFVEKAADILEEYLQKVKEERSET